MRFKFSALTATLVISVIAASSCGSETKAPDLVTTMSDFKVNPVVKELKAGAITIRAENVGQEMHELALFRTDLDIKDLPVDATEGMNEKGDGVKLIAEVEGVSPGAQATFSATVEPGTYILVCNTIANGKKHFKLGMVDKITVTG
jgi:uncharacterized cupredoxin-like copper-binding protein